MSLAPFLAFSHRYVRISLSLTLAPAPRARCTTAGLYRVKVTGSREFFAGVRETRGGGEKAAGGSEGCEKN